MVSSVLFSSRSVEWETPQPFFDKLQREFHFDVDVAASVHNAKCPMYFDEAQNGLLGQWDGFTCWCNPPYGRTVGEWTSKAVISTTASPTTTVVMLLPARTDTKWWHNDVMQADEIRFVQGRLHFGGATAPAPFPSAVVVFRSRSFTPAIKTLTQEKSCTS